MAGPGLWTSIKSLLRRSEAPLFLNDSSAFDFSDEVGDEDFPRFNKLRVVVSDDASEAAPETPANGAPLALPSDDESLLERDGALRSGRAGRAGPCSGCSSRRERCKQRTVKRRLALAALLYLLFMTGELIGGYVANSLAIMTDALHMLTDLSGIILTLLALWLSAKSPTKRFTFGFHRLEVLSAILSVLLVYILMAFLLYEAVQRTIHMDYEINGDIMLITAAVGVAVNLIMGFLLNQSGHLHSHSHSHPHSHVPQSTSPNRAHSSSHGHSSLAVRAAFVHALGDLVQSIGVLVAAYIIRFKPEYKIADPICTYVFSILVVLTTVRILCDTGVIILEGVPRHLNVDRIKEDLMKIEDVYSIEDLNVWSLTAGKTTAIVHLQLVPGSSSKWEEVQSKARQLLLSTFGMYKCSVQLQSYKQEMNKTCLSCQSSSA
ncbi:probable proton-coupled zinc antiporter SLC30A4 isoform X1 [Falco biarmicus]|uniref:Probable proton-coupled zinc antiporter SLC30A4 n=1 Tax=Falco tinnunculus TaxID=100819 RepID=A0A8C4V8L8_FALTI|nr:zinc transporter 4 isoform X1 [Falco rusticolus]XP_055571572.1 probable proton-coupled zinc antiporter SLC30A4 isoform X1 [Falco cherrug]XP_055666095.1 probable proton-coupled zinc antiporter SLC30A4 isoform X1 [Falco peregrinus]XP_056202897.1 probable proton-coupled zinc antiporter SLC30A4 isoform X1 [Falco biarmicus]